MKCDGYAPPKLNASKRSKRREPPSKPDVTVLLPLLSMQSVDQLSLLSDSEKGYLQHFLHWTAKQLSPASAAMNFWLKYALPMSYHYDAIRYSMIAVGASHRAYMAQRLPYSCPDPLQRPVIQHYNRAISSILPVMSAPSDENIHCILICCLLFMTCEGLTGRYDQLLQHLAAGDTVFQSLRHQSSSIASEMLEGLVDMFSEMGLASSGYMGDHPLSGIKKWCRSDTSSDEGCDSMFKTLSEASYALHELRLHHDFQPWNPEREDGPANDSDFEDMLLLWNSRFQVLTERLMPNLSNDEIAHIQTLELHYQSLQMYINVYDNKGRQPPHPYKAFIEAAEKVAAPLIALDQPTFSLDGCLVSGLSFVAISNEGRDERLQALDLLRKLNHREGIFDSNDFVEMHELVAMDMDWGSGSDSDSDSDIEEPDPPLKAPKGIPQMLEVLARKTGTPSKRLEGLYP
ncbi:uncharacterized protein FMAN_06391 [Fusarium mangiferae]|uniref:Zn(II)2Cys6 transcription factor n=1 Tax=Fusarium mangiferae TaxID=192010 RepID=A0A1L7SSW2_FUSMA|nr:uncharacterized protein FMAN_06391 [Fusarium mangiferae]CVK86286.1 uncharacterized protein FMAN_06391 [Fusarium mangiferae]